jgi:hypothetical protein
MSADGTVPEPVEQLKPQALLSSVRLVKPPRTANADRIIVLLWKLHRPTCRKHVNWRASNQWVSQ